VSPVRTTISSGLPTPTPDNNETARVTNQLRESRPLPDIRTGDTFKVPDIRTGDIHIETMHVGEGDASSSSIGDRGSARRGEGIEKHTDIDVPLFAGTLSAMPSPLERLRLDLKEVLARTPRGTQAQLAIGLGLASSTFSNALAGRDRFTATSAAVLCAWVNAAQSNPASPPTIEEFLRRRNDAA
jgi:hypothetical protein